jgi:hypothetical protein
MIYAAHERISLILISPALIRNPGETGKMATKAPRHKAKLLVKKEINHESTKTRKKDKLNLTISKKVKTFEF